MLGSRLFLFWPWPMTMSECVGDAFALIRTWFGMSNHLYTTSVTRHQRWLISWKRCIIKWVLTPGISPWITFIAVNWASWINKFDIIIFYSFFSSFFFLRIFDHFHGLSSRMLVLWRRFWLIFFLKHLSHAMNCSRKTSPNLLWTQPWYSFNYHSFAKRDRSPKSWKIQSTSAKKLLNLYKLPADHKNRPWNFFVLKWFPMNSACRLKTLISIATLKSAYNITIFDGVNRKSFLYRSSKILPCYMQDVNTVLIRCLAI